MILIVFPCFLTHSYLKTIYRIFISGADQDKKGLMFTWHSPCGHQTGLSDNPESPDLNVVVVLNTIYITIQEEPTEKVCTH